MRTFTIPTIISCIFKRLSSLKLNSCRKSSENPVFPRQSLPIINYNQNKPRFSELPWFKICTSTTTIIKKTQDGLTLMPEHIWIKAIPTQTGYTSLTSQPVLTKHAGILCFYYLSHSGDLSITIGETRPGCVFP